MIEIRKIENDFVNKFTNATVDVYETTLGLIRLRDTFIIPLQGIYNIDDTSLQDVIYSKLASIGYEVVVTNGTGSVATPPSQENVYTDVSTPSAEETLQQASDMGIDTSSPETQEILSGVIIDPSLINPNIVTDETDE